MVYNFLSPEFNPSRFLGSGPPSPKETLGSGRSTSPRIRTVSLPRSLLSPEAERDSVHPLVALDPAHLAHGPEAQPITEATRVPTQETLGGGEA